MNKINMLNAVPMMQKAYFITSNSKSGCENVIIDVPAIQKNNDILFSD